MGIILTNQAKQLLIISLNSGKTMHLPPGKSSESVDHLEINGNAKIAKLQDSGAITIAPNKSSNDPF